MSNAAVGGSNARRLVGGVLGIGRLPIGPGTWASLATVIAAGLLFGLTVGGETWGGGAFSGAALGGSGAVRPAVVGVLAVLFVIGIRVGNRAPEDWGCSDPGSFVLDEVVGQGIALMPLLPGPIGWHGALLAFALFRIFDIAKPPPCRQLEGLHGGLGIMADDVAAGLYAAAIVYGMRAAGWLAG